MNAGDIQYALKSRLGNLGYFLGCIPSDYLSSFTIPKVRPKPLMFIVNTLPSTRIGDIGHWVVIVFQKSPLDNIIYIDSLGEPPGRHSDEIKSFLDRNSNMMVYSTNTQIQPLDSAFCAFYTLYFVHKISHYGVTKTLSEAKKDFSISNRNKNDFVVLSYYLIHLNSRECKYVWQNTKPNLHLSICKVLKEYQKY